MTHFVLVLYTTRQQHYSCQPYIPFYLWAAALEKVISLTNGYLFNRFDAGHSRSISLTKTSQRTSSACFNALKLTIKLPSYLQFFICPCIKPKRFDHRDLSSQIPVNSTTRDTNEESLRRWGPFGIYSAGSRDGNKLKIQETNHKAPIR